MRGLLLRLSKLDEGAESAVRIISYFDGLTRNHASADVLVRAASNLAECSTGIRDSNGTTIAFSKAPSGTTDGSAQTIVERPFGAGASGGTVWLERDGAAEPLDDMVLERMAVAAEIVMERRSGLSGSKPEDSVLIRTMVNSRARGVDRQQAARTLGLAGELTIVAVTSERDVARDRDLLNRLGRATGTIARGASMGEHLSALVFASPDAVRISIAAIESELSATETAGIAGPALVGDAPDTWAKARNAMRFARSPDHRIVEVSDLGSLEVLAEIDPARTGLLSDVVALDRIEAATGGEDAMKTLYSVCSTGSIRKTSADLHLHHSSVTARIRKAEGVLGFSLENLDGLFRLSLALKLRELRGPEAASVT